MADIYAVTPADVAAELPGLFPGGFSATTTPTADQVASMISVADTIVALHVQNVAGQPPQAGDRAAPLAKRYVIEFVKAQVVRTLFTGNDPAQVSAAAAPYADLAKQMYDALTLMGSQAEGTGEVSPRVVVSNTAPTRDLVLDDDDLDFRFQRGRF